MYNIKIVRGNIVNATTEAIVCPANNNLMPGNGMNKMIFYSAGDKLIEECARIKYCETGKAVYTSGFGISARYIIHAVGPFWHGGYDNEARNLASCYIEAMKIAQKLNVKSIAIPSLCTGFGGYPLEEAVDIAVSSVTSYLQAHNLDMEVWFMCYDHETIIQYRTKTMNGVGDIEKYFARNDIKIDVKLTKEESSLLKKKLFKKEVSEEQKNQAVASVLRRVIRKKYPECIYLAPPKTKEKITEKTCNKYQKTGPFVTLDCVEEFTYDKERIKLRVKPYAFKDMPEEIASRKHYENDDDNNGIPNEFEAANTSSYKMEQKVIKVLNVESLLNGEGNSEYVDIVQDERNEGIVELADTQTPIEDVSEPEETVEETEVEEVAEITEEEETEEVKETSEKPELQPETKPNQNPQKKQFNNNHHNNKNNFKNKKRQ